ncbi:MAG TPA: hypothetical protein VJ860_14955 [Polyangia bacterium]|jgi:hypothetical protein|nr:hypothetical protein [Polyangia bacterium]
MQFNLPPIIPYAIGCILILFGALRIKYLGAARARKRREDDETAGEASGDRAVEPEERLQRGPEQRRHIRWGIIWVLLGLFLVVSTFIQLRRR